MKKRQSFEEIEDYRQLLKENKQIQEIFNELERNKNSNNVSKEITKPNNQISYEEISDYKELLKENEEIQEIFSEIRNFKTYGTIYNSPYEDQSLLVYNEIKKIKSHIIKNNISKELTEDIILDNKYFYKFVDYNLLDIIDKYFFSKQGSESDKIFFKSVHKSIKIYYDSFDYR